MSSRLRRIAETVALLVVLAAMAWSANLNWASVRVAGGSMRPALCPGDLVVVARHRRAASGGIALLDTVRHGRVLHRIVSVGLDAQASTGCGSSPAAREILKILPIPEGPLPQSGAPL